MQARHSTIVIKKKQISQFWSVQRNTFFFVCLQRENTIQY